MYNHVSFNPLGKDSSLNREGTGLFCSVDQDDAAPARSKRATTSHIQPQPYESRRHSVTTSMHPLSGRIGMEWLTDLRVLRFSAYNTVEDPTLCKF